MTVKETKRRKASFLIGSIYQRVRIFSLLSSWHQQTRTEREREREILFFFCRNEVREWEKTKEELEKILSLEMRRRKEQDDGKIRTPFPLRRKESEEKCHTP